jgi:CheY-like chemotaxis protein
VKTILVVDDESPNAEVLSFILEEEGYRVVCAVNGQQGLERVAEESPDLILLDYMMPVMDGATMGRALRATPQGRAVKLVMNSSMTESALRAHFTDYDAFLRKPYDIDAALKTIRRLLAPD